MPQSEGEKWARLLEIRLPLIANQIRVRFHTRGLPCDGGFDIHSGEFDPKVDRAYHAANPSAPVCVNGYQNDTVTIKTVQGFHFPNLKDADLRYLPVGEIDANMVLLVTARNQPLDGIEAWESPFRSEIWFDAFEGSPRSIQLSNISLFNLCVGRKE